MSGIVGAIGSNSGSGLVSVAPYGGLDYEEGTWTPVRSNGANVGTIHMANFIRMGSLVTCGAYLAMTTNSSGSQVLDGLPFKSTDHSMSTPVNAGGGIPTGSYMRTTDFGTTLHLMYQSGSAQADVGGGSVQGYHLIFTITYICALTAIRTIGHTPSLNE